MRSILGPFSVFSCMNMFKVPGQTHRGRTVQHLKQVESGLLIPCRGQRTTVDMHCRMLFCLAMVVVLWMGCGPKPIYLEGLIDSPEHHVSNGFSLIKKERLEDAKREFEYALKMNPEHSAGHLGMGLVYGLVGDYGTAFKYLEKSKEYARKREEEAQVYVGYMRVHMMRKGQQWLEEVERFFSLAKGAATELAEAYYHMGVAYKQGHRLAEARQAFKQVLQIEKAYVRQALHQLAMVERIENARIETVVGKRIASLDRITRADVAAIMIHELHVDELSRMGLLKRAGPTFLERDASPGERPRDIEGHPYRKEIGEVLNAAIQGLKPSAKGLFSPDEFVTRANFAVMIADLITRLKKDSSEAVSHKGREGAPFMDVKSDAPYFEAVAICRAGGGIMDGRDDRFEPMAAISGADALLSVRRLKDRFGLP